MGKTIMRGAIKVVIKVDNSRLTRAVNPQEERSLPVVDKALGRSHHVAAKVEEKAKMCKVLGPISNFLLLLFLSRIFLWALHCHRRLVRHHLGFSQLFRRDPPTCL